MHPKIIIFLCPQHGGSRFPTSFSPSQITTTWIFALTRSCLQFGYAYKVMEERDAILWYICMTMRNYTIYLYGHEKLYDIPVRTRETTIRYSCTTTRNDTIFLYDYQKRYDIPVQSWTTIYDPKIRLRYTTPRYDPKIRPEIRPRLFTNPGTVGECFYC